MNWYPNSKSKCSTPPSGKPHAPTAVGILIEACSGRPYRAGRPTYRVGRPTYRAGHPTYRAGCPTYRDRSSNIRDGSSIIQGGSSNIQGGSSNIRTGCPTYRPGRPTYRARWGCTVPAYPKPNPRDQRHCITSEPVYSQRGVCGGEWQGIPLHVNGACARIDFVLHAKVLLIVNG